MIQEQWKPIEGTNGQYEVSDCGRVKTNRNRSGLLTLTKQASGYLYAMIEVNGKQKNCRVHRLVAQHFIPNPDGMTEINHKDGNKENNHVSNLEWSNRSANMKHAIRTGLSRPKEHAHHWTDEEREQIRQRQIAYFERIGRRRAEPRRTWAEYQADRKAKAEARKAERLALKASQPPKRRGRPPKQRSGLSF